MKRLNNVIEGLFSPDLDRAAFELEIKEILNDEGLEVIIENDSIILDFDNARWSSLNCYLLKDIDFKQYGITKMYLKNQSSAQIRCDEKCVLDSKKGWVDELHINDRGCTLIDRSLGPCIKNTKIYKDTVGSTLPWTTIMSSWGFDGCEFICDKIYCDMDEDKSCQFKVDCEKLIIFHDNNTYHKQEDDFREFIGAEVVNARDKKVPKRTIEKMSDLGNWANHIIWSDDRYWINFKESGATVLKKFLKRYFKYPPKYKKFSIDYCVNSGYGDHWHTFINCNGRTWSCILYGR